jgi:hypothetical protein
VLREALTVRAGGQGPGRHLPEEELAAWGLVGEETTLVFALAAGSPPPRPNLSAVTAGAESTRASATPCVALMRGHGLYSPMPL